MVAVGSRSLLSNTTGAYNTAVGSHTMENNTTGSENTAVGVQSLGSCTTGNENVGVGSGAGGNAAAGRGRGDRGGHSGCLAVAGGSRRGRLHRRGRGQPGGGARSTPAPLMVRELRKRYRRGVVLDGVSFDLLPGEAMAVIGPNGAGKSTLLGCITADRLPDAGSVRICGHDPFAGREAFALLGHVPEQPFLYPELSVAEVAYVLGYEDPANFGRACRRWFGVSPGKWRARAAHRSPP